MLLADVWRDSWRVPDRRPIYEWAADGNVSLPSVFTVNGSFRVELSRHLIDVFDALHDDQVRSETLMAPPRSGKSMVSDVWLPSILRRDPGPVGVFMQSDPIAEAHFRTRIQPILRETPGLKETFPQRYKWREIIFANGTPLYVSGPSIGNLQSRGMRFVICDEAWLWKEGLLREAKARTLDYYKIGTSKILIISQGGYQDDELDQEFKAGDQREWWVPCLQCGRHQEAAWSGHRPDGSRWGIRWDVPKLSRDDHRNLSDLLGRILPTVRFECLHCSHVHPVDATEHTQSEWNRLGRYEVTNANSRQGHRSHHYSAVITRAWREMVSDFLGALDAYRRGDIEPLRIFHQKDLARSWNETTLEADPLPRESFDVRSKWAEEAIRLFTVDCQDEGVYWGLVHSWSKNGDTRRLWFGQLFGEAQLKAVQAEWEVKPSHVMVDSGDEARAVYAMCARNGWIALKGTDEPHFKHNIAKKGERPNYVYRSISEHYKGDPEKGKITQGKRFAWAFRWSGPSIKARLKRILDGRTSTKFILPADGDPDKEKVYQAQMRAEYRKVEVDPVSGRRKVRWHCPTGNNHLWDCTCMQLVGVTIKEYLTDEPVKDDSREEHVGD